MAFWDRLRFAQTALAALESTDFALGDAGPITTVDGVIRYVNSVGSMGTPVARADALGVPAVQRGRNLICSVSTLPIRQYGPDRKPARATLLDQIDPQVPNVVLVAQTVEDLLMESVAWWHVTGRGWGEFPTSAERIDPGRVSLVRPAGGEPLSYLPSGIDPRSAVWIDRTVIPGRDLIRFDSPNPALLVAARRAIRRAIALEDAAALYADNPRPADYFTARDGEDDPEPDKITTFLGDWSAARDDYATGWVPGWVDYRSVDSPTPRDLQLVELQARCSLDIANAIGLDPEDLGISTTSRTYQNATDRRRDRINDVLSAYMRAITDRLSMNDVTRRGYTVRFDLTDFLKADPITRTSYYKAMLDMGAITVEEIRLAEDMPDLPPQPAPAPAPVVPAPTGGAPMPAQNTALSTQFAGREGVQVTFSMADFKADAAKRTVTGTLIPFGAVGRNRDGAWRFSAGSVEWNKSAISRVKLNREHDRKNLLGAATVLTATDAGIVSAFKVARGPMGDQALSEAEDEVLDGLSAEVDILDYAADPENPGGYLVTRAVLTGAALTATPAFDDARLTSVAASRHEGNTTVDEQTTITPPAPAAVGITLEDVKAAVRDELSAHQPGETAAQISPHRDTGQVREPLPYRFDGVEGANSFSADLRDASRGDFAARERVDKFLSAAFNTATTDVNDLNPTRNRPDLYVDQKEYASPVWDAINKGSINDVTSFTVPAFSSASGLVAAHTEGTEPTAGTFVTTALTVQPAPLSGKVRVNREVLDQGGSPQADALIWRQMQRAWTEALEAKAVAVLAALGSPTTITLTTAAADDALAGEIDAAFVALQYIRGGFRFNDLFVQIDLFKKLAAAVDSTGRKLYPMIGAMNSNGTASPRYASLDVAGVRAYPAWSLAATGSVAASSWLFDREYVAGWASAPQRIDLNTAVATVDIGLWGYAATAVLDTGAVRKISYDPVV